MMKQGLVARCPSCQKVTEHEGQGHFYRCVSCRRSHDLLAGLA